MPDIKLTVDQCRQLRDTLKDYVRLIDLQLAECADAKGATHLLNLWKTRARNLSQYFKRTDM